MEILLTYHFLNVDFKCMENFNRTSHKSVNHLCWQATAAKSLFGKKEPQCYKAENREIRIRKPGRQLIHRLASRLAIISSFLFIGLVQLY